MTAHLFWEVLAIWEKLIFFFPLRRSDESSGAAVVNKHKIVSTTS